MKPEELKSQMNALADSYFGSRPYRGKGNVLEIIIMGGQPLQDLKDAITKANADKAKVKAEIAKLVSTDLYDKFSTDADQKMKDYVAATMTGLENDEQKIAVSSIMQSVRKKPALSVSP